MHSEIWVTEETKVTYPNFANSNSGPKSRTPRTDSCFGGHTVKSSAGNRPCEWVRYCGFLDGGIILPPQLPEGTRAGSEVAGVGAGSLDQPSGQGRRWRKRVNRSTGNPIL